MTKSCHNLHYQLFNSPEAWGPAGQDEGPGGRDWGSAGQVQSTRCEPSQPGLRSSMQGLRSSQPGRFPLLFLGKKDPSHLWPQLVCNRITVKSTTQSLCYLDLPQLCPGTFRETASGQTQLRRVRMLKSVRNAKIKQVRQRVNENSENSEIALIGFAVKK